MYKKSKKNSERYLYILINIKLKIIITRPNFIIFYRMSIINSNLILNYFH